MIGWYPTTSQVASGSQSTYPRLDEYKPMPKLPKRYAPFIYGLIQAAVTTALATAIATKQMAPPGTQILSYWLSSWVLSWITMLPVVLLVAPVIQRVVLVMTGPDTLTPRR